MMRRSLVVMALIWISCIQSHEYISTAEPDVQSLGHINTTEQHHTKIMKRSQTNSIYDCGHPPDSTPQVVTAGRTFCRSNAKCGRGLRSSFRWCHTDFNDRWDYCCDGECNYHGKTFLWCSAGKTWQYCGNCLTKDVQGRSCLSTFPCGVHKNELNQGDRYYWCYVDLDGNWEYCCAPHSKCSMQSKSYNWCYIGVDTKSSTNRRCIPE
ncbi:hypothetical protein ACJMK2_021522 [Sinanodonta woodiana]|uniref:Uncharacterized protein n=1 Tax=Sinanodonta woodiana TaxID=1069815 RepID=A0ABD3TGC0_SINWO